MPSKHSLDADTRFGVPPSRVRIPSGLALRLAAPLRAAFILALSALPSLACQSNASSLQGLDAPLLDSDKPTGEAGGSEGGEAGDSETGNEEGAEAGSGSGGGSVPLDFPQEDETGEEPAPDCLDEGKIPLVQQPFDAYFEALEDKIIPKLLPGETELYDIPTGPQLAQFRQAIGLLLAEEFCDAQEVLEPLDYRLIQLQDGNRTYWVAEEAKTDQGSSLHGWGTFAFNPQAARPELGVWVPHPIFDEDTPAIAYEAEKKQGPAFFFLAGAHRRASAQVVNANGDYRASDMAHWRQTVGHEVHLALVDARQGVIALQIHGFEGDNHNSVTSEEAILSSGSTQFSSNLQDQWSAALGQAGIDHASCGTAGWTTLCATTNVQGQSTPADDSFMSLELEADFRSNPDQWPALVGALD